MFLIIKHRLLLVHIVSMQSSSEENRGHCAENEKFKCGVWETKFRLI